MHVPHGWEIVTLGEITVISQYGINTPSDEGVLYPMLRMNNIQDGSLDLHDLSFVMLLPSEFEKYKLYPDDILINRTNSAELVGKSAIFHAEGDYIFASYLVRFQLDTSRAYPRFIHHFLNSEIGKANLSKLATKGVSQANINPTTLKKRFTIPLPPLAEQRAIAAILGTWDEAIDLTRRLIEALKQRKQALMQLLLTGEVQENWEQAPLSEISEIIVSNVDKVVDDTEISVRLCNYMDVFNNNYITDDMEFMIGSASEHEIKKFRLLSGDVLITKDSETAQDIARAALVVDEMVNTICGYHLAILRPLTDVISGAFLREILSSPEVHNQFVKSANGVTRYGLTYDAIRNISVPFPSSLEQQERISALAQNCDKIVELFKVNVQKLQTQKRGLMQKLLTGQVRVKVEGE